MNTTNDTTLNTLKSFLSDLPNIGYIYNSEKNTFDIEDNQLSIELISLENKKINSKFINNKIEIYRKNNIKLLCFYEDEWLERTEVCKNIIKNELGINNITQVNIKDCEISILPEKIKNSFLTRYSLDGIDTDAKQFIVAYYGDIMIGVLTFKPGKMDTVFDTFKAEEHFIISRLVFNPNYYIENLEAEMLQYFIVNNKVSQITVNVDRRFNTKKHNIYSSMGFKFYKNITTKYKGCEVDKLKFVLEIDSNGKIIENFGYIYKITNLSNKKIYIGQTKRFYKIRFNEYKKFRISHNEYLCRDFYAYNFKDFKFEVIEYCSSDNELNEKEMFYIKQFNSCDKAIGYNLNEGGRNGKLAEETKLKMSLAGKGKKQTEEHVNKRTLKGVDALRYGRPKTEEQKKYLSEALKGEKSPLYGIARTEEVKKKSSETKIANGNTQKVVKWDIVTRTIIGEFNSIAEASKSTGNGESTIRKHCKHEITMYMTPFLYRYLGDVPNFDDLSVTVIDIKENVMTDSSPKIVEKFDLKTGEVIKTYETITQASQDNDLNRVTIVKHCNGEIKVHIREFSFRYKDFVPPQKEVVINEPKPKGAKFTENDIIIFDINNNEIVFSGLTTKDVYNYFSENNIDYEEYTVRRHLREFPNIKIGICSRYIVCKKEDFEKNGGYVKGKIERPSRRKEELDVNEINSLPDNSDEKIIYLYSQNKYSTMTIANSSGRSTMYVVDLLKEKGLYIFEDGIQAKPLHIKYPKIEGKKYIAICKSTGREFHKFEDNATEITKHIKTIYPEYIIETANKRTDLQYKTGDYWFIDYFDIKLIDEIIVETKKCEYCNWLTKDIKNLSGAYGNHLKNIHSISVEEHIKKFENDKQYFYKDK